MNPLSEVRSQRSEVRFFCPLSSVLCLLFSAFCLLFSAGCSDKFLDPTQIGRFRPVPAVNVILDSLGVAEEAPSTWVGAEDPRPIDVMVYETDYVLGSGDIIRIYIFELQQEEVPYVNDFVVTETGNISVPEVGIVRAAGLTESQLEEEIKDILKPDILIEPSVTVALLESQQNTFSISGNGVPRPSRYTIPRYDFRLLDALAIAGVAAQYNISYIYVSRAVTGKEPISEAIEPELAEPKELIVPEQEMLEIIAPRAQRHRPENKFVITSAEMITNQELVEAAFRGGLEPLQNRTDEPIDQGEAGRKEWIFQDGKWIQVQVGRPQPVVKVEPEKPAQPSGRETIGKPIDEQERGRIEWIFQDGKWVPVRIGRPRPKEPVIKVKPEKKTEPLKEKLPTELDWDLMEAAVMQRRVIKIPTDRLTSGDPRYNIVVRPGDNIQVPLDIIGEYFIAGNVNAQGAVTITGRPITLKMAITLAGGLGPLAWPKRCEVIRRISRNKEEIVMVDLDKIASGEQPDFFIKPNDLINVGTHPTARWRAVLRNAFRATYGFGFVYDRNFSDRDFGVHTPLGPFDSDWDPFDLF